MSSAGSRAQAAAQAPAAGEIIGGKFRVERLVGHGGMALVVEATHLELDERVALKLLNRAALRSPELVARFAKEARACAKLKSEHVARVYDVGTREDGSPYIVMEYLEGNDLGAEVEKSGPLPTADAVEYVIHTCEALSEAHMRGIVHRDIKPENLFLVSRAHGKFVKILDFGISKFALTGKSSSVDLEQTGTQRIMGSPYYMSPEQLRSSRSVDYRTDIWSLGTVLFELLTGVRAFPDADDFSALVISIVQDRHRSLLDYMASVPVELIEIVDRCLEKDRERRFESAGELALALVPFAHSRARATADRAVALAESTTRSSLQVRLPSITAARKRHDLHATSAGITVSSPRMEAPKPPASMRARARTPRALIAVVVAGAIFATGAATMLAVQSRTPAPPASAAPPTAMVLAPSSVPTNEAHAEARDVVHLVVRATPDGAHITIDGAETPGNPYEGALRKDGLTHIVRIEAKGYAPRSRTFTARNDATFDIALVRAQAKGAP